MSLVFQNRSAFQVTKITIYDSSFLAHQSVQQQARFQIEQFTFQQKYAKYGFYGIFLLFLPHFSQENVLFLHSFVLYEQMWTILKCILADLRLANERQHDGQENSVVIHDSPPSSIECSFNKCSSMTARSESSKLHEVQE